MLWPGFSLDLEIELRTCELFRRDLPSQVACNDVAKVTSFARRAGIALHDSFRSDAGIGLALWREHLQLAGRLRLARCDTRGGRDQLI